MKTYQPTLDDIVFEHRNRAYGAYELRKSYHVVLRKAVLLGVGFAIIGFGSSFAYLKMHKKVVPDIVAIDLTTTVLSTPEEVKPPIEEEPAPPPPPPPVEKQLEVTAFLLPTAVDNALPETILPPQSELTNVVIGTKDVAGVKTEGLPIVEEPPILPAIGEAITAGFVEDNAPFTRVEMMPEFEGGNKKMYQWLSKNLNYPSAAVRANVQGKVFLNFIVEKDGSITEVKVLKGIGFGCDEEAMRVVKAMPHWKAGRQNGQAVRVAYTIPITFQLD